MSEKHIYDEYRELPAFWGWAVLILFASAIVGFAMWLMMIVPDAPRYWDHGERQDTPAESIYSTYEPSPIATQNKIVNALPEGKPLDKKQQEQEERKMKEENVQERTGRGFKFGL